MQIYEPFAYLVGSDVIEEDLSELRTCDKFTPGNSFKDNIGDWDYHILKKFKKSEQVLTAHFEQFMKRAFNYPTLKWQITTSWLVKLNKGDQIHLHSHKNCIWSGVFYFGDYTDKSTALQFRNPIKEQEHYALGPHAPNKMSHDASIPPEHNLLIFFPSHIKHYSAPSEEDGRVSLAFNLMPRGCYGHGDSTYNTEWMR